MILAAKNFFPQNRIVSVRFCFRYYCRSYISPLIVYIVRAMIFRAHDNIHITNPLKVL